MNFFIFFPFWVIYPTLLTTSEFHEFLNTTDSKTNTPINTTICLFPSPRLNPSTCAYRISPHSLNKTGTKTGNWELCNLHHLPPAFPLLPFNRTACLEAIDGVLNLRASVTSCFKLHFSIKLWDVSTACYRTNAPDGPAEREDTGEHPDAAACNMLDNLPSACKVRRRKTQKKGGLCICLVSGRAFFASELKLQISISKVDILEADSVCTCV